MTSSVPTSRGTAEHYRWGQACDGWHLVRDTTVSVIEERMPSATSELRHRHSRARQFFYVLSGTLTMEVEGTRHRLTSGTGLEIAPGLAHQALNESDADVVFLVVSTPPSHGDRVSAELDAAR